VRAKSAGWSIAQDGNKWITSLTPDEARALDLPASSMKPKVLAAAGFAEQRALAGIGRLDQALAILDKQAGTCVFREMRDSGADD